jgi:hypothetical protein
MAELHAGPLAMRTSAVLSTAHRASRTFTCTGTVAVAGFGHGPVPALHAGAASNSCARVHPQATDSDVASARWSHALDAVQLRVKVREALLEPALHDFYTFAEPGACALCYSTAEPLFTTFSASMCRGAAVLAPARYICTSRAAVSAAVAQQLYCDTPTTRWPRAHTET